MVLYGSIRSKDVKTKSCSKVAKLLEQLLQFLQKVSNDSFGICNYTWLGIWEWGSMFWKVRRFSTWLSTQIIRLVKSCSMSQHLFNRITEVFGYLIGPRNLNYGPRIVLDGTIWPKYVKSQNCSKVANGGLRSCNYPCFCIWACETYFGRL